MLWSYIALVIPGASFVNVYHLSACKQLIQAYVEKGTEAAGSGGDGGEGGLAKRV